MIYAVEGSSVTVKDSTFTNNSADGNENGDAIWLDDSSTLDVALVELEEEIEIFF